MVGSGLLELGMLLGPLVVMAALHMRRIRLRAR